MTPQAAARVVVYVRQGCHLCDDALAVVEACCLERSVPWQAVDVDSDPRLGVRWTDHVPVTVVDGRVLSYWFLDAAELAAALG